MLDKARHELFLAATGDPSLAPTTQEFRARIVALANDAVSRLRPGAAGDRVLLDAQATAVTTVIAGVFTRFIAGYRAVQDADRLARLLRSIATAVALQA